MINASEEEASLIGRDIKKNYNLLQNFTKTEFDLPQNSKIWYLRPKLQNEL